MSIISVSIGGTFAIIIIKNFMDYFEGTKE